MQPRAICPMQPNQRPSFGHAPFSQQIQMPHRWSSTEPAAKNSVEGKLRDSGQRWERTSGEITVGSYVKDILEGRFDQPEGRGAIGKVVSLIPAGTDGEPGAEVDFGRDYSVPINLSELAPVRVIPRD